jgi:hypothetical protein
MKEFASEEELAAVVVTHLQGEGWEVYQEVGSWGQSWADIVAVRKPLVAVVETKMGLGMNVLGQALGWIGAANIVIAAVPLSHTPLASARAIMAFCRATGVGIWKVSRSGVGPYAAPRLMRRRHNRLAESLQDGHKTAAAAGTSGGGRWSPFRDTCSRLRNLVQERPGILLKEAIEATDHHYANDACARSALSKWIDLGKVDGIEKRIEGRRSRLYPITLTERDVAR